MALPVSDLIETWHIHNRVNLYLLTAIDAAHLHAAATTKGRTAGEQFAHLHNVRLMWLKAARPDLLAGPGKIEKNFATHKPLLLESLQQSGTAIAILLEEGFNSGRIKGFTPHPAAFLGYLISHESHHRDQIMLALKQSGHPVDKKVSYGMWEWGSR